MKLIAKSLSKGVGRGPLLVTGDPVSFFGGVDAANGVIVDKLHELYGSSLRGQVLALPRSKGSTVGSYVIYALSKNSSAPSAMILREHDTLVATGCILARIPLVSLRLEDWSLLQNHRSAVVDANDGYVEIH